MTVTARGTNHNVTHPGYSPGKNHHKPSQRVAEIERRKAGHLEPFNSESAIAWRIKYIAEHTT
jgi:hypothetical protein